MIAAQIPQVKPIFEPVHNWQRSIYGQSLLTNFYEQPQRWACTFETLTMICRVQEHVTTQTNNEHIKIMERSLYSGYYCFAKNSYAHGFLSDVEWQLYQQWFSFLVPQKCKAPRGFIYLRVHPDVAYSRIKKRNRLAEKTVGLDYLRQIGARHDAFLLKKEGILPHLKKVPVLILDVNEEFENDESRFTKHIDSLHSFLTQTGSLNMLKNSSSLNSSDGIV